MANCGPTNLTINVFLCGEATNLAIAQFMRRRSQQSQSGSGVLVFGLCWNPEEVGSYSIKGMPQEPGG